MVALFVVLMFAAFILVDVVVQKRYRMREQDRHPELMKWRSKMLME